MIDESKFGRIITINKENFVITGYDFLAKSYLAFGIDYKNNKYIKVYDDIENTVSYDELVTYMDSLIKEYIEIENILDSKTSSDRTDIYNALRRIRECYRNVSVCENLYLHSIYNKNLYKKEIAKHNKGLRRAISKLRKFLNDDEYFVFCEYLRENDYLLDRKFIEIKKKQLIESKKTFINLYEKLMKGIDK